MPKHAEVIKAIADDKPVEWSYANDNVWKLATPLQSDCYNPISNPELDWRIKPPPKVVRWMWLIPEIHPTRRESVQWTLLDKGRFYTEQEVLYQCNSDMPTVQKLEWSRTEFDF